jgi:hypothetical protein
VSLATTRKPPAGSTQPAGSGLEPPLPPLLTAYKETVAPAPTSTTVKTTRSVRWFEFIQAFAYVTNGGRPPDKDM